jgi:hypothetical protein
MNIRSKIFGGESESEKPILPTKQPKGARSDELRSIAVRREEQRRSNSRASDRHRLSSEAASIACKGKKYPAELVNVSGGGAMVETRFKAKLWDKVELRLGEHGTIECAVRWIRDDRLGLEFAHETRLDCSADEQAGILRAAIARSFPEMNFGDAPEPHAPATAPEDEQRTASRHPLIWSGVLHHDYQSTPVRIRNISATGAMIECGTGVRIGAEPLLELAEALSLSATVEWCVGDQVGLRFHAPFDLALLAESAAQVAPQQWVPPEYLNKSAALDSPWDSHWQRLSVSELKLELDGFLKR